MKKIVLVGMLSVFLFSCKNNSKIDHVERAFYYWKSNDYKINDEEQKVLDTLKVKKLYVKFFEVKRDQTMGNIPVAKTNLNRDEWFDKKDKKNTLKIIPTVFIKNEVFLQSSKSEIDTLVSNVNHLVAKYYKERFVNHLDYTEIQIDCDWTIKSKKNYFYFLTELGKISKKELSCTLRLYPFKYRTKMGIPPVKRATLMCYNLIQPFSDNTKNSILDTNELDSYLTVDDKYPIHLDIALPIFSWGFHYQYDEFKRFVGLSKNSIESFCDKKSDLWYEVTKDTVLNDVYYRIGDKIKYEDVSKESITKAITSLKERCHLDKTITVTFFHLDSEVTNKFNYEALHNFYSSFSN